MTEKQKAARNLNLKKAREKRAELTKKKYEAKNEEYDLSSNDETIDSDSSESDDAFILSKKKKTTKPKHKIPLEEKKKNRGMADTNMIFQKNEIDELKNMIYQLATAQKKQNKALKKEPKRSSGGTKIVVLPQPNTPPPTQIRAHTDSSLEVLRKSLGIM